MESKHTPGPWSWTGEDYRAGWGWQILVGPRGEGIIVGQDADGGPSRHLQGYSPVDPSLCITGIAADGKPKVEAVHVFSEANARLIVSAPELLEALDPDTLDAIADEIDCLKHSARAASLRGIAARQRAAIAKARGACHTHP